ncbi:MAG: DUF2202 domain-containing protein [bacterium]
MKTKLVVTAVLFIVSLFIYGCANNPSDSSDANNSVLDQVDQELNSSVLDKFAYLDLSDSEIASLKFMREEEKLARDVYSVFYRKYNMVIFKNINKSETVHTNAIKYLLNKYGIEDPSAIDQPGVFANQDLQNLYNQLIGRGNVSAIEALKVGALIEEVDILDLIHQLNEEVNNQDIVYVYNKLKNGSQNHLRAFVKNLSLQGIQYTPIYLDPILYNSIIR